MTSSTDESTNQSVASMDQSQDGFQTMDQSETVLFNSKGDHSDSSDEELESYYFESDHVALKGNHDYHMLLRTMSLLEAQRIQAVKDLDRLYEAKQEALADPIVFVQKLQRGMDLNLPKPQMVPELPMINWEKYTSQLDFSSFGTHRHMTRLKRQLTDGNKPPVTEDVKPSMQDPDSVVRGRVKTESKSETFNQLWTAEEQKRLEELLVLYPPEEVEAKRFQKIANALGNRTALQVQSRVQKYFIKLARAGLPIPGRMPNMITHRRKTFGRHRASRLLPLSNSTFLTSVTPPVYMNDDDDDDDDNSQGFEGSMMLGMDSSEMPGEDSVSDEETVPVELRDSPEYQELLRLKQLRRQKVKHNLAAASEHVGFKCDRCECEPIIGTRWHCSDCPPDIAVDFCDDCVDSGYETVTHNSSHRLKAKHKADGTGYTDYDYQGFMPDGYNYLDPNYMPAS